MRHREIFRWLVIAAAALALGACGGGGGGTAGPVPAGGGSGQGSINITITNPVQGDEMETPDSSVILEGTASSASAIVSVTWVNDRGGQGEASGTGTWKTGGISLRTGLNRVTITARDESGAAASRAVLIRRESAGTGSVVLEWSAPTRREDGTPLTNLSGFNIYYGRMSEVYDYRVDVRNPGVTSYVVEGLKPGNWHFVLSAYDSEGIESNFSNEVRRTVK